MGVWSSLASSTHGQFLTWLMPQESQKQEGVRMILMLRIFRLFRLARMADYERPGCVDPDARVDGLSAVFHHIHGSRLRDSASGR
mmetsp:Transcript_19591/g.47464  ORF Transcript_19591/g.47464 Transcript_19591/m.47464 type:complete len:85 (-) Transcript_19591:544-798(-)